MVSPVWPAARGDGRGSCTGRDPHGGGRFALVIALAAVLIGCGEAPGPTMSRPVRDEAHRDFRADRSAAAPTPSAAGRATTVPSPVGQAAPASASSAGPTPAAEPRPTALPTPPASATAPSPPLASESFVTPAPPNRRGLDRPALAEDRRHEPARARPIGDALAGWLRRDRRPRRLSRLGAHPHVDIDGRSTLVLTRCERLRPVDDRGGRRGYVLRRHGVHDSGGFLELERARDRGQPVEADGAVAELDIRG